MNLLPKTVLLLITSLLIASCGSDQSPTAAPGTVAASPAPGYALIGKKGHLTFPKMTAEVRYLSDSTLHWKTTDQQGIMAEGDEKISYQQLADHLYFLNWIEQDGWTVSQIIDTKNGTAKAFWSFNDPQSPRGQRSAVFVDGKFAFAQ